MAVNENLLSQLEQMLHWKKSKKVYAEKLGITEEMVDELGKLVGTSPVGEDRDNVHTFLRKVAESKDTTKTGKLKEEELGQLDQTVRSYKELGLISGKIMNNDYFRDYFNDEAEIVTSTSLSKDGFLTSLAVLTRKEIADKTNTTHKKNKGWFGKKKSDESTEL